MGKVIQFPVYLDICAPAGLVEAINRRCGRQRRLVAAFVADAISEKLARDRVDGDDDPSDRA